MPQLNAAQSVLARARLVDPQRRLRPGQSVEVAITGARVSESQVVPAAALVWRVDKPYVFVETARGFVPTPVRLIRQNAQHAEVAGLAADTRVAVSGVAALKSQWLGE
jgi:hypothetical protein